MPGWRNDSDSWGWFAIATHWLTFFSVVGLYLLGAYMIDLSYYDPWYHRAPFWHISVGLLLFALVLFRIISRVLDDRPRALESHCQWERQTASAMHVVLYLLLIISSVSGYLISSADGSGVSFFALFELPSITHKVDNLEDRAGELHILATDALMVLMALHGLAALKHHFVDQDVTLARMLGRNRRDPH